MTRGDNSSVKRNSKNITRNYLINFYVDKVENLNEMSTFLEKHTLPTLIPLEVESLNRPIFLKEIEK
jgi:hypothetical protein